MVAKIDNTASRNTPQLSKYSRAAAIQRRRIWSHFISDPLLRERSHASGFSGTPSARQRQAFRTSPKEI
jgi:hypothetical protein